MKLHEISDREPTGLQGWIAVPRDSLWQKDARNVWVFESHQAAQSAAMSEPARKILDKSAGYMVPIETLNGIHLLIHMSDTGFNASREYENFHVYAYSISEKSCRAAAVKAMEAYGIERKTGFDRGDDIWCYKTYNSDPSYFDEDEE